MSAFGRAAAGTMLASGLLVGVTTAAGAVPPQPVCGVPVAASVTLTANLVCPGGTGLVISAPKVTVNLNGFTVFNSTPSIATGVDMSGAKDKVTNGTLLGWAIGVVLESAAGGSSASGLTVTTSGGLDGIILSSPGSAAVSGNRVVGYNFGIVGSVAAAPSTFSGNDFARDLVPIELGGTVAISGNHIYGDNFGGGALIVEGHATVTGNTIVGVMGSGIEVGSSEPVVVKSNLIEDAPVGIFVVSGLPSVSSNTFIADPSPVLGTVTDGGGNRAQGSGPCAIACKPVAPPGGTAAVCGEVIVTNFTLGNDLSCGANPGLVAGAPDITVNLNGHVLAGTVGGMSGLDDGGHGNVQYKDGTIVGFASAALASGADSRFTKLALLGNQVGANLTADGESLTSSEVIDSSGLGVVVVAPNSATVAGNLVAGGVGGILTTAKVPMVTSNTVLYPLTIGVIAENMTGGQVKGNTVVGGASAGMVISSDAAPAKFSGNSALANLGDGILSTSSTEALSGNTAVDNLIVGIDIVSGVPTATGNKAKGNTALDCFGLSCTA
jgi:hypothetical protein